jgi:transcriptional regulator with PAS, ATPase and Fis domain
MKKILFVVPDEGMIAFAKDALVSNYPDIELVAAFGDNAVKEVRERMAYGLEVVAARPGTALAIKSSSLNVSVVEIPITGFDIIRAVTETGQAVKNLAIVTHTDMILGIGSLAQVLGAKIRHYVVKYGEDFTKALLEASADGADLILGTIRVVDTAKRIDMPCTLIKVGKENLVQAAREAKRIQEALEMETAKHGFLGTILDYSYEGIITIDKEHTITAFNPLAQKLTRISKTAAIGQTIEKILPQLQLGRVSDKGKDDLHSIIDVASSKIMCNKVPIIVNKKSFGAVATFQEVGKIQQMEAMIRQEMYARGHIAAFSFEDIIGKSSAIVQTIETAKDFAATNFSLLVLGETGTGKEIFAQSIHTASNRAKGPFVAINCAALPAQILESELFGYVGGAFTGASKEGKLGLFEIAHGGTIFLDEIAEMDYANQGRLLRFLQEKTVVRLGSHKVIPVDVRVIAATNKNLELLVSENRFRDDLYYRLNVLSLELPPLQERKEDILLYAEAFLNEFSAGSGRRFRLTRDAMRVLEEHPWPGNIRELRNLMARITATAKTDVISNTLLMSMLKRKKTAEDSCSPRENRLTQEITKALADTRGNYSAAAKALGIHRMTLRRRMQRLHIEY